MFPKNLRTLGQIALFAPALILSSAPLVAQATSSTASSLVTTRITQPIDENSRVILGRTVHPLANRANDRGAAPDSMTLERLTLFFKRSDAQESAFRKLINDLHAPGSPSYHQWLTPEQFGKQFGPSDQDLATIQSWLSSHGFSVTRVSAGRQSIEFSGNVAQLRNTFHARLHKYAVNGETHYANANDPQIPAALAPVIGGFASLNNFRVQSASRRLGEATYDPATGKTIPQWTRGSARTGYNFVLAPGDFAVQYDLNPLYSAGTDGTGQTIAVVNDSNINIYLANQFRSLFGLPANPPQVVIDGNDPGIDGINSPYGLNYHSVEAALDVEWAGAVAPKATVDLVIAADTATQTGLYLALEHAIYGNIAPVVSVSFGRCEYSLGNANTFLNNLFEQGAAQGQTILVSTGDSGSAGCDDDTTQNYAIKGQQVNGFASTPYNVAVGGTDFYYSAWNQGGSALDAQIQSYWDLTPGNNTPAVSIKSVIPEQPWNESQYGFNINDFYQLTGTTSITAGGGGASNAAVCSASYDSNGDCRGTLRGYAKPSWQSGTGVPSDGVRDIPDVSLFASSGSNDSFYPICAIDGDCQSVSSGETVQIYGVGGTSASTAAFAGIMALVNQKYGRQGQANFVLYPLAAQYPSAFHDVSAGTVSVPCNINTTSSGYPPFNCIAVSNPITVDDPNFGTATEGQIGSGTAVQYDATAGYDLATGLGTVDANALVSNWNKIAFASTTVTLAPSQTSFTHGTNINIRGSVSGSNPTGDVALMTDSTDPVQQGRTNFPLKAGGSYSASLDYLPGGTYDIWGHYGGDSKNGQADSTKTQITVAPETCGVLLYAVDFTKDVLVPSNSSIAYGTSLSFSALVAPNSDLSALEACRTGTSPCPVFGVPTGVVTFTDSSTNASHIAVINAEGNAEYNTVNQTVSVPFTTLGTHSVTAKYAGDSSYSSSTSSGITYTVVKATPTVNASNPANTIYAGQAFTFTVFVDAGGVGVPPTGTITATGLPVGSPASQSLSLTGIDPYTDATASFANFTVPASASIAGNYNVTFKYGGDSNYNSSSVSGAIPIAAASGLMASTTTITANQSATNPSSLTSITITVTGQGAVPPTGSITLQVSGEVLPYSYTLTPISGTDTSQFAIDVNSSGTFLGANILVAAYSGDSTYAPSTSAPFNVANPLSDFSMVPETTIVPVATGSSATDTINLFSTNSFAGTVNFTCTASTITCSVTPSATLSAGGNTALTLTINAGSSIAGGNYNVLVTGIDSTAQYVHTLAIRTAVAVSPTFTLSGAESIGVKMGKYTTTQITVTPIAGFTGNVALKCALKSFGITCSVTPSTVTLNGKTSVASLLTVSAAYLAVSHDPPYDKLFAVGGGAVLALIAFFGMPARRRSWRTLLAVMVFAALAAQGIGCGVKYGKPEPFTVTVTGTSGSISQTVAVKVTVVAP